MNIYYWSTIRRVDDPTAIFFLNDKVTLRPLPSMPIVRDLIVDLTKFYKQYESVKPWLVGQPESADSVRDYEVKAGGNIYISK